MNELALFAGAGGGILGGKLLGWRTVCAVEWEPYAASVLCARQNDGLFPPFPIWDDVQTFDGRQWRGIVDVVSGGFPCQDISVAGKGAGIEGERSGMWREMARVVCEVRPRYVFVENSPMLTSRGLGTVLGDLASLGYDAKWGVLGAADVGANHQRDRIWILGYTSDSRCKILKDTKRISGKFDSSSDEMADTNVQYGKRWAKSQQPASTGWETWNKPSWGGSEMAYSNVTHGEGNERSERGIEKRAFAFESSWWQIEPNVGRVADGVAARVDRLKAIGNGQVPLCAATAFKILTEGNDV